MPTAHDLKYTQALRRLNLRQLIADHGGPTNLALKLGHSNGSFLSQLAGPNPTRPVSERVARHIEQALDLPLGWLDGMDHSAPVDDTLLVKSIESVVMCALDAGRKLNPAAQAQVVALVYEHAQQHGGVCEEPFVQRLLRLVR